MQIVVERHGIASTVSAEIGVASNRIGKDPIEATAESSLAPRKLVGFLSETGMRLPASGEQERLRVGVRLEPFDHVARPDRTTVADADLPHADFSGVRHDKEHLALSQVERPTRDRHLAGSAINIAAMGEGISQVLPIIARLLRCEQGQCLLVEQPELHLHPRVQSALGDLFLDVALKAKRQVIVETHSEHLILRIRRRIAEGKTIGGEAVTPENVGVLFVEKQAGISSVRELCLNARGSFIDWPDGFFDERYQESMKLAEAASKKPR